MSEKVGVIGMVLKLDSVHSGVSGGVKLYGRDIQKRTVPGIESERSQQVYIVEIPIKVKKLFFVPINVTQNGKTAVAMVCSLDVLTMMTMKQIPVPHLPQAHPRNQLQNVEKTIFTIKILFFSIRIRSKPRIKKEQPLISRVPSILILH